MKQDKHVKFKYLYDPHPVFCTLCYREMCDTVYKEDLDTSKISYGAHWIDNKYVWFLPPNDIEYLNAKICHACGQPVFFKKYQPFDSNYLFVFIHLTGGPSGVEDHVCISVNLSSCEAVATIIRNQHHKVIILDKENFTWIIYNRQALLKYDPQVEGLNGFPCVYATVTYKGISHRIQLGNFVNHSFGKKLSTLFCNLCYNKGKTD